MDEHQQHQLVRVTTVINHAAAGFAGFSLAFAMLVLLSPWLVRLFWLS
jgi:hypothetical protein